LARSHSTAELLPLVFSFYSTCEFAAKSPHPHWWHLCIEISKGNLDLGELPARGKDEISTLAASFNRMHRSLATAMKRLERK